MDINCIQNTQVFSACDAMEKISRPLKRFGISHFTYLKILSNGSRIELNNDPYWTELYWDRFFEFAYPDHVNIEMSVQTNFLYMWDEKVKNTVAIDGRNHFGVNNGIGLMSKRGGFREIFYFASREPSLKMINFYINSVNLLKRFVLYFKQEARGLIEKADETPILLPEDYFEVSAEIVKSSENLWKSHEDFIKETPLKAYHFHAGSDCNKLSAREIECLEWIARGKTYEEVAFILGIKKRTVEAHFENIKKKLNCYNKIQVINKVIDLGLIM